MQDLTKIGKLIRLHGLKGALVLAGNNLTEIQVKKNGFLFVEINSTPTPFFIKEQKQAGKNISILFDGINTTEQAKSLVGKDVWADEKNISYKKNTEKNLQGYEVIDENKGPIGKVNEVISSSHQKFLLLIINDEETLLPYIDAFIKEINHTTKTIFYRAPDGLFNI